MPHYHHIFLSLCCLLASNPAFALSFVMPIDCHYGSDCFIQNYVDANPSTDATDYHCGHLTYDGHRGTDFRLTDFTAMQHGVHVLAAANGTVLRLRNDAPDTGLDHGRDAISDKECGNGLVIAHAEGYQTQYCHMKRGSIQVHVGAAVKAGDVLGQVGYSGMTEFPHVHFQVSHYGAIVDPFNTTPDASCAASLHSLWAPDVAEHLPYIETAVLGAGFSDHLPQRDRIEAPLVPMPQLASDTAMLTFWVNLMGLHAGDRLVMKVTAPDGMAVVEKTTIITHVQATAFQFIGKRLHAPLVAGTYTGDIRVERNRSVVAYRTVSITIAARAVP